MNLNEEILFKKPLISNKNEDEGENTETTDESSIKEVTNAQSVSKTVLPQPMTELVPPVGQYIIDQLKNGVIVDNKVVAKSRVVFGRAQDCDVILEHPSVSRYHAVLLWSPFNEQQFQSGENNESFWYLVDCGSTHGTNCNKTSITAGKLIKLIPNNNVFKFGASTRFFTLRSTLEDSDEDEDITDESNSLNKSKPKPKDIESDVCDWGINEDQIEEKSEESGDSKSLQAIILAMKSTGTEGLQTDNSNAYSANPNKCLQQWFEREGYELEFKCDSIHNKFKSTIDLPIDGQWIPVEGSLLHKKKEAITDVCLKSCQLLDKAELLFPWQQKSQALKRKKEEDSDSDTDMIDETVKFSLKRNRKDSESNDDSNVENFETLNKKWTEINEELCKLRVRLANIGLKADERSDSIPESGDSLDNFMATISRQKYGLSMSDKIEKSNLRMKINVLVKEQERLEKLIKLARPSVELEPIPQPIPQQSKTESQAIPSISETTIKIESIDEKTDKSEPIIETIVENERKEEIKRKTEQILNDLKSSSKPKSDSIGKSSKQRVRPQSIVEAIEKEKKLEKSQQKLSYDNDYVDWLPPNNQSGDGKTSLNDKLGY